MKVLWLLFCLCPFVVEALSFSEAFDRIEQHYPAFQQLSDERQSQRAAALPGYFSMLPTLTASANQRDTYSSFDEFSRARTVGLASAWTLFSGGANWADMRLSAYGRELADVSYRQKVLVLEKEVFLALFEYLVSREKVEVASSRIDNKEKSLRVAEQMYLRGRIPKMEYEKLRIELSNVKAQYEDLLLSQADSSLEMLRYLGEEKLEVQWPWVESLKKVASSIKSENFTETLHQNVDYQLAELELEAQDPMVAKARAAWLPKLLLEGSYGRAFDGYDALGDRNSWGLTLTLSVPLFQKLAAWAPYRSQVHTRASKMKSLEISKRTSLKHLSFSREELLVSVRTALARDEILVRSRELFERSLKLFQQGRVDVNYLATDEDRWLTSRELSLDGWRRAHMAYVEYCHHRGKRFKECSWQ